VRRPTEEDVVLETIAVGTDGSATATKAVEFALDLAERYKAKLVFISSYRPVSESRLRQEQKEAPQELQWSLNPAEDVEATLRDVEGLADEREDPAPSFPRFGQKPVERKPLLFPPQQHPSILTRWPPGCERTALLRTFEPPTEGGQ